MPDARGLWSATLFGPYASGEARPDSDIDILVDGGPFRDRVVGEGIVS